ncbi:MAG: TfuA-like protein [Paracoccaceae bacterium]
MIAVFAGPTLHGLDTRAYPGIAFHPPAGFGDIARAAREGATSIGLVDGVFEQQRSVWHKGDPVRHGGRRAGAGRGQPRRLRAVECEAYGMEGVGEIFTEYREGRRTRDADVAVIHGPAELGFLPLSLAQVDVEHSLRRMQALGILSARDGASVAAASRAIFFKTRTRASLAAACKGLTGVDLAEALSRYWVDRKGADARLLLDRIAS